MVPVSYDGYVIGDGILFYLDKDEAGVRRRVPSVNWIQFHGETGGFKVDMIRDDRSPSHPRGKAVGAPVTIAIRYRGRMLPKCWKSSTAVRFPTSNSSPRMPSHQGSQGARPASRMAGAPGLELWGPYAEGDEIRDAILEAGRESIWCPWVRALTPAIRWNRDGSPRPCRPCTRAKK